MEIFLGLLAVFGFSFVTVFLAIAWKMPGSFKQMCAGAGFLATLAVFFSLYLELRDPTKTEKINASVPSTSSQQNSEARTFTQAPSSSPGSKTIQIENYQYKGDTISITCSGDVGNIKCVPAR